MSTSGNANTAANGAEEPPITDLQQEPVDEPFDGEIEITNRHNSPYPEVVQEAPRNDEDVLNGNVSWRDEVDQLRQELAAARSSERSMKSELDYIINLVHRILLDGEYQAERRLCEHLKIQCKNLTLRAEPALTESRASMSPEQLVHLSMRTMELDDILNQHKLYLENQPIHTLSRPQSGVLQVRPMSRSSRPPSGLRKLKPHVVIPSTTNGSNRPRSPPNLRLGPIGNDPDDEQLTVRDILATPASTQQVIPITTPTYLVYPNSADIASSPRNDDRRTDKYSYDPVGYRTALFSTKGLLKSRAKSAKSVYRPTSAHSTSKPENTDASAPNAHYREKSLPSAAVNIPTVNDQTVDAAVNRTHEQDTQPQRAPQLRAKSAASRKQLSVKFNDMSLRVQEQHSMVSDDSARIHQMESEFKHKALDLLQKRLGLDEHGLI